MRIRVYLPKGETLLFEHVETLVAVGEPVTWQPGVLIYNPEHIIGMQVFADVPQAPEASAWKVTQVSPTTFSTAAVELTSGRSA